MSPAGYSLAVLSSNRLRFADRLQWWGSFRLRSTGKTSQAVRRRPLLPSSKPAEMRAFYSGTDKVLVSHRRRGSSCGTRRLQTGFASFSSAAGSLMPTPGPLGTLINPFFTTIGGSNQAPYCSMPSLYSWYFPISSTTLAKCSM